MASPAKTQKLDNEISGYIHDVSPIKCSAKNTKYFTCLIQNDRDEYHKGVVFNPNKHRELEQVSGFDLEDIVVDIGYWFKGSTNRKGYLTGFNGNQSTGDNYDVMVNRQSSMLVTDFPFPWKKPIQNQSMTLQQAAAQRPFQSVGETDVKVLNIGSFTDMVHIYGTVMEVQYCYVTDQTAQMKVI
ncbi:unnamed protein product [Lota lota]